MKQNKKTTRSFFVGYCFDLWYNFFNIHHIEYMIMLDLELSLEQQLNRFERHHKQKVPTGADYTRTETGFADPKLNSLFEGWQMAVTAQSADEVTLYFSGTYGWQFEYIETGGGVLSPEFETYADQEQAIAWAKSQGLIVVKVED